MSGDPEVRAFASRSGASARVVVLDASPNRSATVSLSAPGTRLATIEPLRGAGLRRTGAVSFAGLHIGADGRLRGRPALTELGGRARFSVRLPPASADLIFLRG